MEKIRNLSYEELQVLLDTSPSLREVSRKLGIPSFSSSARLGISTKIKAGVLEGEICLDKFQTNKKTGGKGFKKPLKEHLVCNKPTNGQRLKKKLIDERVKTDLCEKCGQGPIWNGKLLVLQLDHKNGDNTDNRIENLRILCPNCHTQTKTFSGKNCMRKTKPVKKCSKCKTVMPLSEFNKNKSRCDGLQTFCKKCSKETSKNFYEKKKVNRPG